ncbi:carboxypeptidase regulatory-like domain-containing protein [Gorillibacterium massiliense]|uniref:carboxypeptidase regulatory-like domain-containing protein n=1 Tax=Gorillibacterium massiliense TaxID=1280390 RepID=UPI0004AD5BC1|nr:carboxypeptidase regulatory-like domain-containing protein [Gorillibacterium massiliense]
MRIRIKVKHLVLLVAIVLVAVPLLRLAIYPGNKALGGIGTVLSQHGSSDKEALIREMIDSPVAKRWKLIRKNVILPGMDSLKQGGAFNVYVGSSSSQSSQGTSENGGPAFTTGQKIPLLDDYVRNAPVDDDYVRAVRQLSVCYLLQGHIDLALDALETGRERMEGRSQSYLLTLVDLDRASLYVQAGRIGEAEKLADELGDAKASGDNETQLLALRIQLLLNKGEWKQAKERLEEAYGARTERSDASMPMGSSDSESSKDAKSAPAPSASREGPEFQGYSSLIRMIGKAQSSGAKEAAVYSGTVKRSDGESVAGAGVFLRLAADVNHSVISSEPYQTTTDADGRFSFIGVAPGSYQLYLGLTFDQISGWVWPVDTDEWIEVKAGDRLEQTVVFQPLIQLDSPVNLQKVTEPVIDFTWEPVKGADYYALELGIQIEGGWIGSPAFSHIRDTHLQVKAEELYDIKFGYSASSTEPNKDHAWPDIDSNSLLGFSNPDNRFYWSVKAYDADGHLLSKSEGYRLKEAEAGNLPQFYLRQRTMTEADQLVKKRRYEEALAAYKSAYAADPGDAHSLNMILRLLESRNSFSDAKTGEEDRLHYLELLTELRPTPENLANLASTYYEKRDWPIFNRSYGQYLKIRQIDDNGYMDAIGAQGYFKQNKLPEAEAQFARSLAADRSHRFIGAYIALALRTDLTFDRALKLAEQYPDYSWSIDNVNPHKWPEMLKAMRQEAGDDKAYMTELANRMDGFLSDKPETIRDWQAPRGRSAMKDFLEKLLEVK